MCQILSVYKIHHRKLRFTVQYSEVTEQHMISLEADPGSNPALSPAPSFVI